MSFTSVLITGALTGSSAAAIIFGQEDVCGPSSR